MICVSAPHLSWISVISPNRLDFPRRNISVYIARTMHHKASDSSSTQKADFQDNEGSINRIRIRLRVKNKGFW